MTLDEVIAILQGENPKAKPDALRIYADAVVTYMEATENIAKVGAITSHPRTGAPLENPYLKVRNAAARLITRSFFRTGNIWDRWPDHEPPQR
jgi:phage terminase small subunit